MPSIALWGSHRCTQDELGGHQHAARFRRTAVSDPIEQHAGGDTADLRLVPADNCNRWGEQFSQFGMARRNHRDIFRYLQTASPYRAQHARQHVDTARNDGRRSAMHDDTDRARTSDSAHLGGLQARALKWLEEVDGRYRGQLSEGTLRTWRSMRIGPSFIETGKAILYPLEELDRRNRVACRPSRSLKSDID
jgi:hypothetical protein